MLQTWRYSIIKFKTAFVEWQWLGAWGIAFFIASLYTADIQQNAQDLGFSANIWDAVFRMLGTYQVHFYLFNLVFILLISNIGRYATFDEQLLFRLGSRTKRWLGHSLLIIHYGLLFGALILSASLIVALVQLPFSPHWSALTYAHTHQFIFSSYDATHLTPLLALCIMMFLLIMQWIMFGIMFCLLYELSQRLVWSIIGVALLNLSGIVALTLDLSGKWNLWYHNHTLLGYHNFGQHALHLPTLIQSCFYWGIVLAALISIGIWHSHHQENLAKPI